MFMSCLEMSTRFMAMFLLVFGCHICTCSLVGRQHGWCLKTKLYDLGNTFLRIARKQKNCTDLNLSKTFRISLRFLIEFIHFHTGQ